MPMAFGSVIENVTISIVVHLLTELQNAYLEMVEIQGSDANTSLPILLVKSFSTARGDNQRSPCTETLMVQVCDFAHEGTGPICHEKQVPWLG